ncbi:hypothetical protein BX666DRAFT_1957878 [Dichotomocladium elegans]|nr:hypothetical protein BX666DRAFT_1957878 [Dichotomocladium elegans]
MLLPLYYELLIFSLPLSNVICTGFTLSLCTYMHYITHPPFERNQKSAMKIMKSCNREFILRPSFNNAMGCLALFYGFEVTDGSPTTSILLLLQMLPRSQKKKKDHMLW